MDSDLTPKTSGITMGELTEEARRLKPYSIVEGEHHRVANISRLLGIPLISLWNGEMQATVPGTCIERPEPR